MHRFASGALSSKQLPWFHLIPKAALVLLAERFEMGAKLRGEEWSHRKGVNDEEFFRDRINHLIDHVFSFAVTRSPEDLGAILCNASMLADIQSLKNPKLGSKLGSSTELRAWFETLYKHRTSEHARGSTWHTK